jgi:predicted PurR-regulated permease PerM
MGMTVGAKHEDDGWLSRERASALALIVITAVVIVLCYRLTLPFLPALAWALALAVMTHPIHHRLKVWIPFPNLAALLSVIAVAILIVAPVVFVTRHLVNEVGTYSQILQRELESGKWRTKLAKNAKLRFMLPWIESQLGLEPLKDSTSSAQEESGNNPESTSAPPAAPTTEQAEPEAMPKGLSPVSRAAMMLKEGVGSVINGSIWLAMQLFITLVALFFFFRDRREALAVLRSLMPLSNHETDIVFKRVDDTIHATIYGSLVVAMIQGTMGGLMFWWLGLPAPLMWGAIMALLAVVPVLGTFVVWAPTAAYLAIQGDWTKALILTGWGSVAIGLIDNFLYPFLVGKRLRFHTLVVFIAIVGGLTLFGASGVILGPLLLAIGDALLDVWRRRTAYGGTIEGGVETAT